MTTVLDREKFAKVARLMRSTSHAGERNAARQRAEAMAAAAGLSLDEAIAHVETPPSAPPSYVDIFAGFDDWQEEREPGYKARCAAEKTERERQRLERRAAIIARFGSEKAALAPCGRERILRAALGSLAKPCEPPHQRWTSEIEGCNDGIFNVPDRIRTIVSSAYSLPTTFTAARAEFEYWETRQREMADVLGPGNFGDCALDFVAELRSEVVRALVEHELPTTTLDDLHARFALYRDMEIDNVEIEAALFRDLTTIVEQRHLSSGLSTNDAAYANPSSVDRIGQIRAALDADPSRSDRDIARAGRCSPTTVGRVRSTMGLAGAPRTVRRGGQAFEMQFGQASPPRPMREEKNR